MDDSNYPTIRPEHLPWSARIAIKTVTIVPPAANVRRISSLFSLKPNLWSPKSQKTRKNHKSHKSHSNPNNNSNPNSHSNPNPKSPDPASVVLVLHPASNTRQMVRIQSYDFIGRTR